MQQQCVLIQHAPSIPVPAVISRTVASLDSERLRQREWKCTTVQRRVERSEQPRAAAGTLVHVMFNDGWYEGLASGGTVRIRRWRKISLQPHPHPACSQRPLRSAKYTILVIYLINFFAYLFFCLHSGMHHSAAVYLYIFVCL